MKAGANYLGNGRCAFSLWAPKVEKAALHITSPDNRLLAMQKDGQGYFHIETDGIQPGTKYFFQLNGKNDRPDPASHFQPDGLHKASQVIDHQSYQWNDHHWQGIDLQDMIIYELHIGTFTQEGTFKALIPRLDDLVDTGINAIEILPISQFPGNRNWGYDGVHPYSVQNSYGTPDDFRALVDACHARGIAVILDMVYNHLGPEGNYVTEMGPYFINKYHTPWGAALNFDDHYSDPVRDFFAESAVFFMEYYHVDALRLDAIHAIYDMGAKHFWQYVNEKVDAFSTQKGRRFYMIAESDLNDTKVITPLEKGGFGFDTQWMDDFHHALHALLTKERTGYYADFGNIESLAKSIQDGFVHDGYYSAHRKRIFGNSSANISGEHFVVCTQNHDQVGNRMMGDRLSQLMSFDALKAAAATMFVSPYVPMLFMGEEYAEENPFLYFVSHTDPGLVEAVRRGRRAEFAAFSWLGEAPDPQAESTFQQSKLQWHKRNEGKHAQMHQWYKQLIRLRKEHPALHNPDKKCLQVSILQDKILAIQRWKAQNYLLCLINYADQPATFRLSAYQGTWHKLLDGADKAWGGNGNLLQPTVQDGDEITISAFGVALYRR